MEVSTMSDREIHAVIGVWYRAGKTFYVRRSATMKNYPNVWSLLSIQFKPATYQEQTDLPFVQSLMDEMSRQRLGGVSIDVRRYLSSAHCSDNPMKKHVFLHMYAVELGCLPRLNREFYQQSAWLHPEEYTRRSQGAACGLCLRMWSDYSVRHSLVARPFAPPVQFLNEAESDPDEWHKGYHGTLETTLSSSSTR